MIIAIGNDHAGVEMKNKIIKHLEKKGMKLKTMEQTTRKV